MKRKLAIKFLAVAMVICCLFTIPTYAHSGRTDSNGGHKDNKNKSGLGSYHYHCGGYPAHLHSGGVCPYKSTAAKSTTTTSTLKSTAKIDETKKTESKVGIVATDIKTFINDNEIPTFLYNGSTTDTVIIAEDLRNYGFDKSWNQESQTLTITKNSKKEIKPMDMEYYNKLNQGQFLYDVIKSNIKVVLKKSSDSEAITATKIYCLNGYTAISTDELKNFGEFNWDNETRTIKVTVEQKKGKKTQQN